MKRKAFSLVTVDKMQLDSEWVEHPNEVHKAARRLEDAKDEVARAKAALAVCEAELALSIRKRPKKYGMSSVREAAIKSLVLIQPERKKAIGRLHKAMHRQGMFEARVKALDHKKKSLENLVTLWSRDYFSRPKTSEETSDKVKEVLDRQRMKRIRNAGRSSVNGSR